MLFYHDGQNIPKAPPKDPDATTDYGCDFTGWLQENETVTVSSWIIGAGLTGATETNTGLITGVMLSGGSEGSKYTVTNRVATSLGRTVDRSMIIECVQL